MKASFTAIAALLNTSVLAAPTTYHLTHSTAAGTKLTFTRAGNNTVTEPTTFPSEAAAALSAVFDIISQIPEEVLAAGNAPTYTWLAENDLLDPSFVTVIPIHDESGPAGVEEHEVSSTAAAVGGETMRKIKKVGACITSIGQLFASSTLMPALKFLRIKQYVRVLGGTKEAVQMMMGASTVAQQIKVGGKELVELVAEFRDIAPVRESCF